MEIKYSLDTMVMKGFEVIAYKIYAGAYIFWVSPQVFLQALKGGLIESENEDGQPYYIGCKEMNLNTISEAGIGKIRDSIENSTVGWLREELEVVNEIPPIIYMEYVRINIWFGTISLMIKSHTVDIRAKSVSEGSQAEMEIALLQETAAKGYAAVLDYIARSIDREYMNSGNLMRKVRDYRNHLTFNPYQISLHY